LKEELIAPHVPAGHVYFPEQGIVSITNADGDQTELGVIGREGMVGAHVLLGSDRLPYRCFVQMAGTALRIPLSDMKAAMLARPALRDHLLLYIHPLMIQTTQTAFANARHSIETRLARWLLMCHDRVDGDDLALTHEFMSMMLGVRRAGVTVALHALEGEKAIFASRGRIAVRDRARLEEMAQECYGLAEAEYERVLGRHDGAAGSI